MAKADFVTSIVVILLGLGALVQSLRMPRFEHLQVDPYTVPGIVPAILGAVLSVMGAILLVRSILRGGWQIKATGFGGLIFNPATGRLAVGLALTLGYAAGLVGRLPYWLATAVFVFLFVTVYEWSATDNSRRRVMSLATALVLAAVVAVVVTMVFQLVFLVRLP